jgi:murein DD-endopeptidase MepM/ murein hydrolase activator NlpD
MVVKRETVRLLVWPAAVVVLSLFVCGAWAVSGWYGIGAGGMKKGYGIRETGLVPVYPAGYACSALSSLYGSWIDIDGTRRDEVHSGVDGGELGEPILAPASGTVKAVWEADWRWGKEGALVLAHTAEDLNLSGGAPFYYSVFDHLKYDDIKHWRVGDKVARGDELARVFRPGGKAKYLPEVHWEVWEVDDDHLTWVTNRYGAPEWRNESAQLIDPLYMLGLHAPPRDRTSVEIVPFESARDYSGFRGFTYIFQCRKA